MMRNGLDLRPGDRAFVVAESGRIVDLARVLAVADRGDGPWLRCACWQGGARWIDAWDLVTVREQRERGNG